MDVDATPGAAVRGCLRGRTSAARRHLASRVSTDELERNRQDETALDDLMFTQCRACDGVEQYVSATYIQHNPGVGDGSTGAFIDYLERVTVEYPGRHVEFVRTAADGDLAVQHCRQPWPGGDDHAGIDIFRLDDADGVLEQWDVVYIAPSASASSNGMF